MYETHADGTLNLDAFTEELNAAEREILTEEGGEWYVLAVCGACWAHISNGEEDHELTPPELTKWMEAHPYYWVAGSVVEPDGYWACEACRSEEIGSAQIISA